jgi:hypothetical protein
MATPRKLWETNVGLRPATHIMSTFVCLAIVVLRKPTPQSFLSSTETTKIHGSFYFLEAAAGTVE